MRPRDPREEGRSASALELFYDLIFVVAVSLASAQLGQMGLSGKPGQGVVEYLLVFFAIWWAWMNFTWFASAFDTDDWPYRVLALTQMAGVVVLAVGTTPAMRSGDFSLIIAGYVIMRLALCGQWLRASRSHPAFRKTALRYVTGILIVQPLWVLYPLTPQGFKIPVFVLLALCELAVPVFAESARQTPWNPNHIADRYGSFTLIVLGESVLASTTAIANALGEAEHVGGLVLLGAGGFVIAAGMWWVYFATDVIDQLGVVKTALPFGYGHYLVFASAGAFSAGIAVLIGLEDGTGKLGAVASAATLTVPVALFVLGVWALILRHRLHGVRRVLVPIGAVALAATALLPHAVVFAAMVMVALVIVVESSCLGQRVAGDTLHPEDECIGPVSHPA
ncbi:low temperature requirement protein A [Leucobacter sp. CSA2]|uniref:Low temperature requirement protein A n=2 Tax=Leucobacter edaphi TaxID=2796472 RepID=A0A934QDJ1_9MICO|nr:low temperature requirement protein A [Leucobacter edaphi]